MKIVHLLSRLFFVSLFFINQNTALYAGKRTAEVSNMEDECSSFMAVEASEDFLGRRTIRINPNGGWHLQGKSISATSLEEEQIARMNEIVVNLFESAEEDDITAFTYLLGKIKADEVMYYISKKGIEYKHKTLISILSNLFKENKSPNQKVMLDILNNNLRNEAEHARDALEGVTNSFSSMQVDFNPITQPSKKQKKLI